MIRAFASRLVPGGLALLASLLPLRGQESRAGEVGAEQKLIQALFESEDAPSIASAIAAARKGKVADQAILEAQFLFLIDQQDFKAVAALAPVLEKQRAAFRIDDSVIFSIPEEFFAIIEYCHALEALEKGDEAEFKSRITEAFWLSPRQATAFASHIEGLRQEKIIAKLKVDQNAKFASQGSGKLVSLASLANNAKCHVVHFWSPWSEQCEANLPDFIAMTEELTRNKIPVTSVMIETGAEALKAAKEFRAGIKRENLGDWIVDNSKVSLARKLRVVELPTVALLTLEGGVLFSGHPSDDGFWNALTKIVPNTKRPRLDPAR